MGNQPLDNSQVWFIWAIHRGNDVKWSKGKLQSLKMDLSRGTFHFHSVQGSESFEETREAAVFLFV